MSAIKPRRRKLNLVERRLEGFIRAKPGAWFYVHVNLRADPRVRFTAPDGLTGEYVAREAEGEERERLWDEAVDCYAGYATYEERAGSRVIPVVVLEPVSS